MLGHERQIKRERDFMVFDFPKASREEFVISVDLRSSEISKETLADCSSLESPLSLNPQHFERLRLRNDVMNCEEERACRV